MFIAIILICEGKLIKC